MFLHLHFSFLYINTNEDLRNTLAVKSNMLMDEMKPKTKQKKKTKTKSYFNLVTDLTIRPNKLEFNYKSCFLRELFKFYCGFVLLVCFLFNVLFCFLFLFYFALCFFPIFLFCFVFRLCLV